MGQYIDADYFLNEYSGTVSDEDELERLIEEAEDDINSASNYRIYDFSSLPDKVKKLIKKAVCAQVENRDEYSGCESLSIGDFSCKKRNDETAISKRAVSYLSDAGFYYAGDVLY